MERGFEKKYDVIAFEENFIWKKKFGGERR